MLVWLETMVWYETLDAHVNAVVMQFEQHTLFIHPFYAFIRLFIYMSLLPLKLLHLYRYFSTNITWVI